MGVALLLSVVVMTSKTSSPRQFLFLALFVVVNAGYITFIKDPQFEDRAAPTQQLLRELAKRPPGPTAVVDFPYNPWVAKLTTRLVPGWSPRALRVNEEAEQCRPECPLLTWDAAASIYRLKE